MLTNDVMNRDIARHIFAVAIVTKKYLISGLGLRMLFISSAIANLGVVSASMPTSAATRPHSIADGMCSGVRASTCFPAP